MIGSLGEVGKIPELRKRILFTLGMLAVYRMGVFVSTPGINVATLRSMFDTSQGTIFGMINMFSGGALENFSIFTLGIAPYISVSIIMQVLTPTIPALEALKKEGDAGQRIITRYTRYGTVILALFQGYMIAQGLERQAGLVLVPGWSFRIATMITLTAGTAFIMWLGEQITEKGIGNGSSIVIFAGIIAQMPSVFHSTVSLSRTGEISPMSILLLIIFTVLTIGAIVHVERSHRKIPIQHPRRMVGKHVAQQTQYMPLKVNMAGVIPPIFASAFLVVPATIASFSTSDAVKDLMVYFTPGHIVYTTVFIVLIVLFSFFYNGVVFNPQEVAENLKKSGSFIPTVRPGKPTADYLYSVMTRLTLWGATYISLVCILPQLVYLELGAQSFAYVFGGTAILIVVGVTLDTASQIESHIVAKNYESFMSKGVKVRGGLGSMSYQRSRLLRR